MSSRSTSSSAYRQPGRTAAHTFRMSEEDKDHLVEQAKEAGVSVQALLEFRVFGYALRERRPGRVPKSQGELFKAG